MENTVGVDLVAGADLPIGSLGVRFPLSPRSS